MTTITWQLLFMVGDVCQVNLEYSATFDYGLSEELIINDFNYILGLKILETK